jgi:hypothetical protein
MSPYPIPADREELQAAVERLEKRATEIERHVEKVPGWYPEAIQHAADLRLLIASHRARGEALVAVRQNVAFELQHSSPTVPKSTLEDIDKIAASALSPIPQEQDR